MKKELCIAIILVALLAALAVHQTAQEGPATVPTSTFLADGSPDYVLLQEKDGFPLYFVRNGDQWQLTLDGTMYYPVDMIRFTAFLTEISRTHDVTDTGIRDHRVHNTGNRARYRLESGVRNGPEKTIFFGETDRTEQFRYISCDDDVVYRTDNGIHPFLDSRTARWVDVQPFATIFAKTGLQRAVLSQDGATPQILPRNALEGLQRALEELYCTDITNIPATPEWKLDLELGNLSTTTVEFSRLSADHVIMTEDVHDAAWIIPAETMNLIFSFFSR